MKRWIWLLLVLGGVSASLDALAQALAFDARVTCMHAVETEYAKRRLSTDGDGISQPPQLSSEESLRLKLKAQDALGMSAALAEWAGTELDTGSFQRELDRIAASTRVPEALEAMFAALQNDPQRIAECLLRPRLARELLREQFQQKDSQLRHLRGQALEAAAQGMQWPAESTQVERITLVPQMSEAVGEALSSRQPDAGDAIPLPREAWVELEARLRRPPEFSVLLDGRNREVRTDESDDALRVWRIISHSEQRIELEVWRFAKPSFDAWWQQRRAQYATRALPGLGPLQLPELLKGRAEELGDSGSWLSSYRPQHRAGHSSVWTGSEMLVWGGVDDPLILRSGARYDPSTDSWSELSDRDATGRLYGHRAVWTGTEMLVWGGFSSHSQVYCHARGWRFDPVTEAWSAMSEVGAASGCSSASVLWTGSEMIVWGGYGSLHGDPGAAYSPELDQWRPLPSQGQPSLRRGQVEAWTGSEMLIWGGYDWDWDYSKSTVGSEGFRYDPVEDRWSRTAWQGAPSMPRSGMASAWTGSHWVVWGGVRDGSDCAWVEADGARYDPVNDVWQAIPASPYAAPACRVQTIWTGSVVLFVPEQTGPGPIVVHAYDPATNLWLDLPSITAPPARSGFTAHWSGSELLLFGGSSGQEHWSRGLRSLGSRFDPASGRWRGMGRGDIYRPRAGASATWTGTELVVLGGQVTNWPMPGGARYDPALDAWQAVALSPLALGRSLHQAFWTGSEIILWGGLGDPQPERYQPSTDSWVGMTAPPVENKASRAAWTGSELLVWGGSSSRGARYDPIANQWSPMSEQGAPPPRRGHSLVWTGQRVMAWGGRDDSYRRDGWSYDPGTDSWAPISGLGAPAARSDHGVVWTGREILVWGGWNAGLQHDGGRYDPDLDAWLPMSMEGASAGTMLQPMVWTGSRVLFWGHGPTPSSTILEGSLWFSPSLSPLAHAYDPLADRWNALPVAVGPSPRRGAAIAWSGDRMMVWGGVGGDYMNDLWHYFPGAVGDGVGWVILRDGFEP